MLHRDSSSLVKVSADTKDRQDLRLKEKQRQQEIDFPGRGKWRTTIYNDSFK